MTSQELEALLYTLLGLLICISLYAAWLRLNLWFTHQAFSRIAVIQASQEAPAQPERNGCGGILLLLLVIAPLLTLLILSG
jgi:hypothetical protein